jgi:hypothetical protein
MMETIVWGPSPMTGTAKPKSKCVTVLASQNDSKLDYAFLRVEPAPEVSVPVDLKVRPKAGTTITLFSNGWGPLSWSRTCALLTERTDITPSAPSAPSASSIFYYDCTTVPGSSGATILREDTVQVVGIHSGGYDTARGINFGTYLLDTPIGEFIK